MQCGLYCIVFSVVMINQQYTYTFVTITHYIFEHAQACINKATCIFLYIHVYPCIFLYIPVYPCVYIPVYISLYIPVYPCIFLYIPVYPVDSNDRLYSGERRFLHEVITTIHTLLEVISTHIKSLTTPPEEVRPWLLLPWKYTCS